MVNSEKPSLPPLPRLLLAYSKAAERPWHALCWQLDQRLAAVVRRQGDPMITAIRLAWWDAVLVERDPTKGAGEPLVEEWRARVGEDGAKEAVERLIDGWRVLASPEQLTEQDLADYAQARGSGLYALLNGPSGGVAGDALAREGAVWALWDLAGHLKDEEQAARAMKVAKELLDHWQRPDNYRAVSRPLRLLSSVAIPDVRAGRIPTGGFSLKHYARLLIAGLHV